MMGFAKRCNTGTDCQLNEKTRKYCQKGGNEIRHCCEKETGQNVCRFRKRPDVMRLHVGLEKGEFKDHLQRASMGRLTLLELMKKK